MFEVKTIPEILYFRYNKITNERIMLKNNKQGSIYIIKSKQILFSNDCLIKLI